MKDLSQEYEAHVSNCGNCCRWLHRLLTSLR